MRRNKKRARHHERKGVDRGYQDSFERIEIFPAAAVFYILEPLEAKINAKGGENMTVQTVREDLREIRYYYACKQRLQGHSESAGNNQVVDLVKRYNTAIQNAPVRLYDLYCSLYIDNNTQEGLAEKWCYSVEYIKKLSKKLNQYLASAIC